ncbi:hypothetical protein [Spirosoma litoris]
MRFLLPACLLALGTSALFAQTTPVPTKLVHFPHYVAIGPSAYTMNTPSGYYLAVEGGILTEKLRVASKSSGNWADYVLAPSYKLMPLANVESFIKHNGHLPGIPSAKEIAKQGIDVVSMQTSMMAKIEELTLHAIQQEKEIKRLRQQLRKVTPKAPLHP